MPGPVARIVGSHALAAIGMSMPWPALLVATWDTTGSEAWLAVVGAARMAPYVLLSWAAGMLGDRRDRLTLLRRTTQARLVLLVTASLLLAGDAVLAAAAVATLAVAAGTPAYPALAAGMPQIAGRQAEAATRWLVTVEVSAFVLGPAIGGLVLGVVGTQASVAGSVVATAAALVVLRGAPRRCAPAEPSTRDRTGSVPGPAGALRTLLSVPSAMRAIAAVALVNGVIGALGVGLLSLAEQSWSAGERAFGVTTAALGFGALATPLVAAALRLGPRAVRGGLVLTAGTLLAVAVAPTWWWALVPLVLVGAGATQVECAVTEVIQTSVPDSARAFALGVTDTAMVSVALLGAASAPFLAGLTTPRLLVMLLVTATVAVVLVEVVAGWRGASTRPTSEPTPARVPADAHAAAAD